jgi:hypothetical protein
VQVYAHIEARSKTLSMGLGVGELWPLTISRQASRSSSALDLVADLQGHFDVLAWTELLRGKRPIAGLVGGEGWDSNPHADLLRPSDFAVAN